MRFGETQLRVIERVHPHRSGRELHDGLLRRLSRVRPHVGVVERRHEVQHEVLVHPRVVDQLGPHQPRPLGERGEGDIATDAVLPFELVAVGEEGQVGRHFPRVEAALPVHIGHHDLAAVVAREDAQVKPQAALQVANVGNAVVGLGVAAPGRQPQVVRVGQRGKAAHRLCSGGVGGGGMPIGVQQPGGAAGSQRGPREETSSSHASVVSQKNGCLLRRGKSGRGQPHSRTLRGFGHLVRRGSVLECGCPLPLSFASARVIVRHPTSRPGDDFKHDRMYESWRQYEPGTRGISLPGASPFLYIGGCFATAPVSASDPFPLTPALSLRERENGRQCVGESEPSGMFERWRRWLPLPEGEGRGEGERGSRLAGGYIGLAVGPHKR